MLYSFVALTFVIAACVGAEKVKPENKSNMMKTSFRRTVEARLQKALEKKHEGHRKTEADFEAEAVAKHAHRDYHNYVHIHGYSDGSCETDPLEVTTFALNTCHESEVYGGSYKLIGWRLRHDAIYLVAWYYESADCSGSLADYDYLSSVFPFTCGGYDDDWSAPDDHYYYSWIEHDLAGFKATVSKQLSDHGKVAGAGYKTYATSSDCADDTNNNVLLVDWFKAGGCLPDGDGSDEVVCDSENSRINWIHYDSSECSGESDTYHASTSTCFGDLGTSTRIIAFCGKDNLKPVTVNPCESSLRGGKTLNCEE